ncbi:Hypothetical protein D9617_34g041080 [Elsinoe fawcettii]|nr:Hypothetical protein D9617_34g041080 [Elsinoe fawcettii]
MTDTQDKTIIERTRSVLMSPDTNGTAFYAVRDAILSRISRPLVQQVLHVCGLLKPSLLMDSHAPSNHVQDLVGFGEDCLDGTSDHVSSSPSLLADEELITVREILRNCRLLDLNAGNHPLLMKSISPITEADLNRRRSAIDPDEILKKAQNYEAEIMSALHYSNVDSSRAPPHASMDKRMGMQRIGSTTTIEALDVVRNASTKLLDVCGDDDLLEALRQDFHTLNTSPRQPSSHEESFSMLTPFQPLFVTQLRLVTGANLRIFLREENLESHLDTHFQFHLLGNRTFLKRLQMTLFDTKATIGPRNLVQGNFAVATDAIDQHWPPGTVQLWNALSGLFSETYQHRTAESSWSKRAAIAGIPGHVNVAVREVDQPERTEIMDPLSTRALDFLRLRSTHSAALSTIFDSEATQHYDDIFRLLLVPLRQNHIIANLGRVILSRYANLSSGGRTAAARFANLCQAITASLSAYIFDLALLPPWDDMMNAIKVLCDDLDDEEADEVYGGRVKTSVTGLADLHHHTLTTIKSRLFLAPNKDIESRQIMQIYALLLQGNSSLARLLQPADTDIAEMANEVSILNELEASLRKAVQDLRHSLRNAQPFSSTGQARIKSLWRDFGMLPPEDDQHEIINMLERSLDLEPVFGSHDEPWNSS